MKTKMLLALMFSGIIVWGLVGCKKEGNGGKKSIVGTVYYYDGVNAINNIAPGATIYVTYGSKKAAGNIDETLTSDAKGEYSIKGLKRDDYFVWAEYTTSHGFEYSTAGHGLSIDANDDKVTLNLRLY